MSDGLGPMPHGELKSRLADLATALAFPPTPDLAAAVGSRLRATSEAGASRPRLLPLTRSLRRSLLLAAALALLVVGGALAVRIGLEFLSIELGKSQARRLLPQLRVHPERWAPVSVWELR